MRTLIIYLEDGQEFDKIKLTNDLSTIEGVNELNGKNFDNSDVACEFSFQNDLATLRLEGKPDAISIEGISDAGIQLAWELQNQENRVLRVTDNDYSFNFGLKGINTVEELKRKIGAGYFDKEATAMEKEQEAKTA